ncbi:MAG TPA: GNAT family N-acetyltransferase [Cytophagaceae bacterium]|jgi:ribosomal protein S18 acetylase RimI-like enzyme
MIKIAPANAEDLIQVQQLAYQIWPITFRSILSEEQMGYMLEMMYSLTSLKDQVEIRGHKFLLAKEGLNYVGYASYQIHYKKPGTCKIHKLYILPTQQGKGTGKQLIEYIKELSERQGCDTITINVNRNNPAVRFYERMNFKIIREENIPIGNGYFMEDFVMEGNSAVD